MDVTKLMLGRIFDTTERLEAPLFQRPYVWNRDRNWDPLWDAIETLAQKRLAGSPVRPHFLGTVVLDQLRTPPGRVHARQIIDGQQRLTTLQLALAAARDIARAHGQTNHELAFRRLTDNSVPLSTCTEDVFKIWPTNADREDFRAVMTAGSLEAVRKLPHADPDDEWLIPDAYQYFWDKFTGWLGTAAGPDFPARLDALYYTFVEGLQVVVINLEDKDDAQEIFETLNALGTPLLPADLVKNFLFHEAIEQKHDTTVLYDQYWRVFDTDRNYWREEVRQGRLKRPRLDLFLYHYLTLMHGEVILDTQLFVSYKSFFSENNGHCAAKHMALFRTYADAYRGFDSYPRNSREELFFYRLQQFDISTLHPLMLEICKRYAAPEDQPLRVQVMQDIESFLVRRMVCELTPKNYNRLFTDLIKKAHQADDFSPAFIRKTLSEETAETSFWPTDDEFRDAWEGLDFYKRLKKSKTRVILEAIERELYDEKSGNVEFDRILTLEHLLPQEPTLADWPLPCDMADELAVEQAKKTRRDNLHKIGNLTLLTQKLNSSVSNGPWNAKVDEILLRSPLNLNRPFKDVTAWSETAIQSRTKALFKVALCIWPRPYNESLSLARRAAQGETRRNVSGDGAKEGWNGEYYVSFGPMEYRSWEDARTYGYICAGGGAWYSQTLKMLSPGDRVWVNIPTVGFVGVGRVIAPAVPAKEFKITTPQGERSPLEILKHSDLYKDTADDPEKTEWFVRIKWLDTVPEDKPIKELGFFGNQNSVCQPVTPLWNHTVDRLKTYFPQWNTQTE